MSYLDTEDGTVHLWRLWYYSRLANLADPFPRWAPDLALGHGLPLFTFANPAPYALGAVLAALGLSAAESSRALFTLALAAGALGAYLLGARCAPRLPVVVGLCAALVYTADPYALANVYQRGALPEVAGRAVAPFAVLAAMGAAQGARGAVAGLGAAAGGLVLTHTITALWALPFAAVVGLAHALTRPAPVRRRALISLATGIAFGAGLSAQYWLPVLAQLDSVQAERVVWGTASMDPSAELVWPWQLVQPTPLHRYGATGVSLGRLGGPTALLLCVGAAAALLRRSSVPAALVAGAATLVALALITPLAGLAWHAFPPLGVIQQPWRLIGLLLLAAPPLVAACVGGRGRAGPILTVALAVAVAAGVAAALPVVVLEWHRGFERPAELNAYELKSGQIGLVSFREWLPRSARIEPDDLPALPPEAGPPGAPAIDVSADPGRWPRRYAVESSSGADLRLDVFAHPSIQALLDGSPVRPVQDPRGLAIVRVVPGERDLVVGSRPLPAERAGSAMTLASAALLLAVAVGPARAAACLLVGAALWLGLRAATPDSPESSHPIELTAPAVLGRAKLLAVDADPSLVPSLGILTLDLHLLVVRAFDDDQTMTLRLRRDDSTIALWRGTPGAGLRPTAGWRTNDLIVARTEVRLPVGMTAGDAELEVELDGASASVGRLALPGSGAVPLRALLPPPHRHEQLFGEELAVDSHTTDERWTERGVRSQIRLRRVAGGADEYDLTLQLVDKQGGELASATRRVGGSANLRPDAGLSLRLAEAPRPESYRLELRVAPAGGAPLPVRGVGADGDRLVLRWIDVIDPCACVPPDAARPPIRFRDGISLAGWRVERRSADVLVELYWQADAAPSRDYKVFLHLLDGEQTVAQVDDRPNAGRRPTHAWVAGDVVRDAYRLPAMGKATAVRVGLYGDDGRRLPTEPPSQHDAATLPLSS